MNTTITRRTFLKTSLATAAALAVPRWSWAKPAGANSDIRVAVVGFHNQGSGHVNKLRKM
jgi:hypothetical protein